MHSMLKVSAIAVLVMVAISFSGCCCCYGLDGFTSKFTKSVDLIKFPSKFVSGGKAYTLMKSQFFSTVEACKTGISNALGDEGLGGKFTDSDIGNALGFAGGQEAKTFEYSDDSGQKRVGGVVGKGDSPGKLSASFVAGKQVLDGNSDVTFVESFDAGDEAYVYHTDEFRAPAYIAMCRYSNMFIYACSYDSAQSAEDAVRAAIEAIDAANA